MNIEEFGVDMDKSVAFIIETLHQLHKGHDDVSKELATEMIPYYKNQLNDEFNTIKDLINIIDYSTILSEFHVKMIFGEDLLEIPLISEDDKYLSLEERIDLLISKKTDNKLFKLRKNTYLFFNHYK